MGEMIMKLDPNREFWNPKIELMSRDEIRDLQFKKLKKQLKYNCRKSPFYKERFDQAGVKPEDVRTREDFQYVPTFSPRVTGEFRIFLDAPGPRVQPPLKVQVEYRKGVTPEDLPELNKERREKMRYLLRVTPEITFVPPNIFERSTHKSRFIVKTYEKK
jgi:phenylacetate-coenzyme A ligase PaaK-like adenylate-forming protein